jgi:hypothetical protein
LLYIIFLKYAVIKITVTCIELDDELCRSVGDREANTSSGFQQENGEEFDSCFAESYYCSVGLHKLEPAILFTLNCRCRTCATEK